MNNIGTKIMLLRKQNEMSQSDLAKKLNVSNKLISKWETGGSLPSTEYLPKICQIFNIKINELMGEEDFKETKTKHSMGKVSIVTIACLICFCLYIAFCHLTLAPIILKRTYVRDIENHLDKTFSGTHYYLTTTIEIDDVPTIIEEYGYYNNGKVEYTQSIDGELQIIIKDGVKFEDNKRRVFDNSQIKSLSEVYELSEENDKEFATFEDAEFVDYIYKQFNGYYFEVNKGVLNRYIDEELNSDMRVTSKVKGDVDFSKGKLKTITMSFKAKSNNVPIDVKVKQSFDLKKAKQIVEFPEDINTKYWADIECKDIEDYLEDERVQYLNLALPNIFKASDKIVSYDVNNIYVYNNNNLELEKTIKVHRLIDMSYYMNKEDFYFNVVEDYVFIKEANNDITSELYILNLETEEWSNDLTMKEILYVSSTFKIYYLLTESQLKCYDLISKATINLIGQHFIAEIDGCVYTCDTLLNEFDNGIYQLKNNTSSLISNLEMTGGYVYEDLIFVSKYNFNNTYNGNKIFDKNFEEIGRLPFSPNYIIEDLENVIVVANLLCNFYNYENLYLPPIKFNVDSLIAIDGYYIMKKETDNKLYKVEKSFIDDLGGW